MEVVRIPLIAVGFVPPRSLKQSVSFAFSSPCFALYSALHQLTWNNSCVPSSISFTHVFPQFFPLIARLFFPACETSAALYPVPANIDSKYSDFSGRRRLTLSHMAAGHFSKASRNLSLQLCKDSNLVCCHAVLIVLPDRSTRNFLFSFCFIFKQRKHFYSIILSSFKNVKTEEKKYSAI